jgi:hypothetical protein
VSSPNSAVSGHAPCSASKPANASNARPVTLTRLEDILGWQPGSVQAVLAGREPKRTRDPQLERLAVLWPALTVRQRRALVAFVEEILAEP